MAEGGDDGGDYEIGFGKPPKAHQFPKGVSGNPGGRKKGSRGLKTDLNAELSSVLTISINKQPVSGTKQRLMLKSLATRAAAGDVRAAALLIPLVLQIFGFEDRGTERRALSRQDQALLDSILARTDGDQGETGDDHPMLSGPTGESGSTDLKSPDTRSDGEDA